MLVPAALATERRGDAALGAVSGAVVFGPIGALAGAVVGYTAGPSIAHSWGLRRSGSKRFARERSRREASPSRMTQNAAASQDAMGMARPSPLPRAAPASARLPAAPPVQPLE
jgi:hypothetical protein